MWFSYGKTYIFVLTSGFVIIILFIADVVVQNAKNNRWHCSGLPRCVVEKLVPHGATSACPSMERIHLSYRLLLHQGMRKLPAFRLSAQSRVLADIAIAHSVRNEFYFHVLLHSLRNRTLILLCVMAEGFILVVVGSQEFAWKVSNLIESRSKVPTSARF